MSVVIWYSSMVERPIQSGKMLVRSPIQANGGHNNGLWRSLVARLSGGQKVAGSNPVSPTSQTNSAAGVRLMPEE